MKIEETLLVKNPCYKSGKTIKVKGLMLHSVGCPQPKASVFVKNWNSEDCKSKCVHAFIDGETPTVYQTLPWEHRGWHAGSGKKGSANNTHIGVEMCEPSGIKYTSGANFKIEDKTEAVRVATNTYNTAVELFAYLCKKFNLDPLADGVIIGHKEGCDRGIASNHADPEHIWKGLGLSYTMNSFRKDVKNAMEPKTYTTPDNPPQTNKEYKVRVNITNLNIRKGPGTNYKTNGLCPVGNYTIVNTKSGTGSKKGWGELKSGAGWISLDFVEKI